MIRSCLGKRFFGGLVLFCLMASGAPGWAQYPAKPITLMIGLGAGGGTDITIRALSDTASKILGQPIVVVNKPGGGGALALATLKNEKPDGYTIGNIASGGIINTFMRKLPYDVVKDFSPIMSFSDSFGGVVVRADSPFKTFKDLVDYAKKNPGKIKYGTSGLGLVHHLAMEQLAIQQNMKWVMIPFKSGGELMVGILGGHVDAAAAAPDFVPYTKSGKLRLLAVYANKRLPGFPDCPTFKELGYNVGMRITTGALIGPKGMPRPVVEKLAGAFKTAMDDPKFKTAMKNFENQVLYRGPEELGKDIQEWSDTYGKLIKQLDLKEE